MLDYSDDESQPRPVRRRNLSPKRETYEGVIPFRRAEPGPPDTFTISTHSMFREWREKSCKLIMPKRHPPMTDAFIISEFIPAKPLKPAHNLDKFEEDSKGSNFTATSDRPPPDFDDHPDSFYKSMRTLLLLAQFFAVLPVSGIRGSNYKKIIFRWIHYKTALWGLAFLGTMFCFVCETMNGVGEGTFEAASGVVYFACGVLSSLLMLSLSRNWKHLNGEFAEVEWKLKKYGYPKKIGVKFKIFTILVLVGALVEHILAKLKNFEMAMECAQHRTDFFEVLESFFLREYHQVFALCSYSFWKGALVLVAHFLSTASWNFKDLFLALISWTIAERFKQVHDLLDKVHGQDKPISFWKEIREDYNTLSVLTKRIDAFIRKLMFLSMGNNLFFICIQLFHSLKKKTDSFRLIYFFWSFGFLVLRTGSVAFSAARINDESKEPKPILYSVPQNNYTAEVRRFLTQLTTNEVALTGSGFFSITRSLILTIIGSVITYEIVLVQFGSAEMQDEPNGNGTMCPRK